MALDKVALDGAFVRLEPLEARHREAIRPATQHPEIFTYFAPLAGPLYDPYFDSALARNDGTLEIAFAVLHKADGRYVGMTRYLAIDELHKRLEIGSTWYEPAVWAGVVNPECKLLLMRHAFETLKFRRVEYKTDARNARSRAAILRLGAKQEGIFRKHMIMPDGHVRDSVYFSIVDDEWPEVKAGLAKRLQA